MFGRAMLWFVMYMVTGMVLAVIYSVTLFIIMARRFGLDIANKAATGVRKENGSCCKAYEVFLFVVGWIAWPSRIADRAVPDAMFDKAEEIKKEREKKVEELSMEEGS